MLSLKLLSILTQVSKLSYGSLYSPKTELNSEAPLEARTYVKDPLDTTSGDAPEAGDKEADAPEASAPVKKEKKADKPAAAEFDTSVDDVVVDEGLKGL